MPKRRSERREPTHDWQQIQPLLKDTAQVNYEVIRPVILWGVTPKERSAETGVSPRTIYGSVAKIFKLIKMKYILKSYESKNGKRCTLFLLENVLLLQLLSSF